MKLSQLFFGMFLLTLIAIFGVYYITTQTTQQIIGGGPQITIPGAYTPFPLSNLRIYLKDASSPTTSVGTSTVKGTIFSINTPDEGVRSPLTPYVDTAQISNGALSFTSGKVMTSTSYKLKIWDSASTPTWYPELKVISVPALPSGVDNYTGEDVYLTKIGTFADIMQADATGAGGGSLPTGVTSSHATNTITINSSKVATDTFTIRIPLTFANVVTGSKIKNVVLVPKQDTSDPFPVSAFSSATLTYASGTNFNVVSDLMPYIMSQQPLPLGDWTDATAGVYYLQITLIKSQLTDDGQTFYFYLDDQGNWLATDNIAGQSGASPVYVKLLVDLISE